MLVEVAAQHQFDWLCFCMVKRSITSTGSSPAQPTTNLGAKPWPDSWSNFSWYVPEVMPWWDTEALVFFCQRPA